MFDASRSDEKSLPDRPRVCCRQFITVMLTSCQFHKHQISHSGGNFVSKISQRYNLYIKFFNFSLALNYKIKPFFRQGDKAFNP